MKRLLKGGRVVDPAAGMDGNVRRADRRRSHRARSARSAGQPGGRRRGRRSAGGTGGVSRASSTCTCTCASRGRSTRKRSRPASRRRSPADSPPSRACRIPSRSTTTPASRADPAEGGAKPVSRACIRSARCRAARKASSSPTSPSCAPPAASRSPTMGSGGDGDPGAPRARIHQHVRHADDRALRRSVAQGRRLSRTKDRVAAALGLQGHSRRRRSDHRRPRHAARRDDRRPRAHRAHERLDDARSGAAGQEPRRQGDVRSVPASLHADRRSARRADRLRHQHQDEPAAARSARSRRDDRGNRRRQRRRDRDRSCAASLRREECRVRSRAVRHRRPRNGDPDLRSTGWCTRASSGCRAWSS